MIAASAHTQDFNRWPLANLTLLFFDLRLDFTNSNRVQDPNYGVVTGLLRELERLQTSLQKRKDRPEDR